MYKYLYEQRPSFEWFENWVPELNGGDVSTDMPKLFNDLVGGKHPDEQDENYAYQMTTENWDFWNKDAFPVIKSAVPQEGCMDFVVWHHVLPHGASHKNRNISRLCSVCKFSRGDNRPLRQMDIAC